MKRWACVLGLVLLPSLGAAQTLNWTYPSGTAATGFHIYRAPATGTPPVCGAYTNIGNTTMTVMTYKDLTAQAGAAYCYGLTAYNANTESPRLTLPFTVPLPLPSTFTITASLMRANPGAAGTLISVPFGLDADQPGMYQAQFATGTTVLLTVYPRANGSRFLGWGVACAPAGTSPTCSVTMTADLAVSATFAR